MNILYRLLSNLTIGDYNNQLKNKIEVNNLYRLVNLFDGEFDYREKVIHFSSKRFFINILIEYVSYWFFFTNLFVSLIDNEHFKREMIYFQLHQGTGQKQITILVGIAELAFALPIRVHRKYGEKFRKQISEKNQYNKNKNDLETLSFLFCYDEYEMQTRFSLNQRRARNQIKAQLIFEKLVWPSFIFYSIYISFYIFKFASDHSNNHRFSVFVLLRIILYIFLFLINLTGVVRSFVVISHFSLSCLYLQNHLNTMIDRIENNFIKNLDAKRLERFCHQLLVGYNRILRNQKILNEHCERNLYILLTYLCFTLCLPIIVMLENPNET